VTASTPEPPPTRPVDVNAHIGGYPWRHVPHPEPAVLARVLEREGLAGAWVGHLPSAFWRDPAPGNAELYAALAPHPTLHPAPAVRPDWPGWERHVRDAADRGAPALRAYPQLWGLAPGDASLDRLAAACAEAGLALVLSARFEDGRQRHPLDTAPDLQPAHVRALARSALGAAVVVVNAGHDFVTEVVWALADAERARVWFDFSWLWGPPDDQFARLLRTAGADRFVYGTGWPLRLTQNARALLDLLPADVADPPLAHAGALVARARAG
jgi:predicted TIM-barrel fold metal-dependent hydrolase